MVINTPSACSRLKTTQSQQTFFYALAQFKSLKKRLDKDETLKNHTQKQIVMNMTKGMQFKLMPQKPIREGLVSSSPPSDEPQPAVKSSARPEWSIHFLWIFPN